MALIIDWEPFSSVWPEAIDLARAHFQEVEGSLTAKRPFNVNAEDMRKFDEAGIIRIITARIDGKLVGYTTITIMPDIESMGMTFGNQGAIYVAPGHQKLWLGSKMVDFAAAGAKALGCKYMLLHHRLLGRGVKMGALFRRKKAVPIKHEYFMWLAD